MITVKIEDHEKWYVDPEYLGDLRKWLEEHGTNSLSDDDIVIDFEATKGISKNKELEEEDE